MRHLNRFFLFSCVLAFMGVMNSAHASVAVRLPLPDLVKTSSLVVRGKVTQAKSYQDPETKRIMTCHTLAVAEVWKGAEAKSVQVITMGGELEELGQWVPGEAVIVPDEDIVVFLQPTQGGYSVTGMSQGLFRVQKRLDRNVLVRDLSGIQFVGEVVPTVRADSAVLEEVGFEQLRTLCKTAGR